MTMYLIDFVDFNIFSLITTITFLVISLAVEITWYLIYPKNWHNSVYIDDGSLVNFRRYEKYISWVSMGLKSVLLIVLIAAIFIIKKEPKKYATDPTLNYPLRWLIIFIY